MMATEASKKKQIPDSQEEEGNDIEAMSMSGDNVSNAGVDEEIFKGNVQMSQQEFNTASPKQVETVIKKNPGFATNLKSKY
jgi:hypothetical protein